MAPKQCKEFASNFKKEMTTLSQDASTCQDRVHTKTQQSCHTSPLYNVQAQYDIKVQDKYYEHEPVTVTEN